MIKIYTPNDEVELSMIRGLLDSEGIRFFVHNDHFGSMEAGPHLEHFNRKTVMVAPDDADRAKHVIAEFLGRGHSEEYRVNSGFSLGRKFRMLCEAVFLWWIIPGKKRYKSPDDA